MPDISSDGRQPWSGWLRGVAAWGLLALGMSVALWGFGRAIALVAPALLVVAVTGTVWALTPRPVNDDHEAQNAPRVPFDMTADQAFDYLRRISSNSNRKVAEVAAEIAQTRRLPDAP